ncbi:hypothetical protein RFI_14888, partial [Reticulomyxa filosa]
EEEQEDKAKKKGGNVLGYNRFRTLYRQKLKEEKYEECEQLCLEQLDLNCRDSIRAKLHNRLGYLYEYYMDGKVFDDILERYVLAFQADQFNISTNYNLANFLVQQGIKHFNAIQQINPKLQLRFFALLGHEQQRGYAVIAIPLIFFFCFV